MTSGHDMGAMGWVSVASAVMAAAILLVHLLRRGEVTTTTRLWLLMGLGVLPIITAGTANIAGFEATQSRKFCGSCHVMIPHAEDSGDPNSLSLAAVHARNEYFGQNNCYTCHKDYGMYGYVLTKAGGMRHVYLYLTGYRDMPLSESKPSIRIRKPMPNANCMHCHTATAPDWLRVPDHASALDSVRSGKLSCASVGCHGFAHPVTKLGKELELDGGVRP